MSEKGIQTAIAIVSLLMGVMMFASSCSSSDAPGVRYPITTPLVDPVTEKVIEL